MTPTSAVPAAAGKLGVLGGTFDPIHLGHIAAADAAQRALGLHNILLVPSRIPPHRADPVSAGADHRYAMAQLAANKPGWSASRIELDREGPSYTYDTLVELGRGRALSERSDSPGEPFRESKGTQLFFITGADAFAEIATWSRYPAVLDLANFVVVSRPGITLDSLRDRVPSAFEPRASAKTRVILVEAHTPDVSSTEIRRRVRAGERLSGLVPDAVDRYIRTHHLYR
ncbi:MAG TPA: nicotinate-nucleotide adenylyltransferase [Vicinamibacterales bacterium]|nr:nicotinate-nucleotide adenylyltransferase [Vicinamibacterales bacterium]